MIKTVFKRFLLLMVTAVLVLNLIPATAIPTYAATVEGMPSGITITYDNGSWSKSSDSPLTLAGSVSGTGSCSGGSTVSSTVTITNNSGSVKKISFQYSGSIVNAGSLTINGENKGSGTDKKTTDIAPNSYTSGVIKNGESVKLVLKSGKGTDSTSNLTLTNITMLDVPLDVTFQLDENGSYTVNGTQITAQQTITAASFTVKATPADRFVAWIDVSTGQYFSLSAECILPVAESITVKPVFTTANKEAWFSVGGVPYSNLTEACAAASGGSSKTVVLMNNGILTGSYTIPSGVTLLIPFDSANTVIRENMKDMIENDDYTQHPDKVEYRSLTMPSGTKITVESGGAICVGSKAHKMMVGQTGPYGAVYMDSGSNITLESGSNLYAWGYVFHGNSGAGTVTAKNGSNVYESLIIMDYPGDAGVTLDLYGGQGSGVTAASKNLNGGRAFPMRSYTVRNVEVPMTVCYGATSYGFYHLYGTLAGNHGGNVAFIGPESNGIFRLMDSGSSLTKSYTGGRQKMTIDGNTEIHPLEIKISTGLVSGTITSSKVSGLVLPSSYDVLCASGTGIAKDNIILCEGSTFEVADGAFAKIPSGLNMYILDMDDDPGAVASTDVHGISYTNVSNGDALLNVNGTVIIEGGFYTSNGKASIISSEGTGKIQISAPSGDKTVDLKYGTNIVKDDIPVTAAYLQNGDKVSYVSTATGGNYHYDAEAKAWHCDTHVGVETDHICDVCAAVTECTDADDHNCDICGKEAISECVDALLQNASMRSAERLRPLKRFLIHLVKQFARRK